MPDLWEALADPRRRRLIVALSKRESANLTELSERSTITRQAISKHLETLREAKLVKATRVGREVRYRLNPGPLSEAVEWVSAVGKEWDQRLDMLDRYVKQSRRGARGSSGAGRTKAR